MMARAKIVNNDQVALVRLDTLCEGDWFVYSGRLYVMVISADGSIQAVKAADGVADALPGHVMVQPVDVEITFRAQAKQQQQEQG